MERKFEIDIFKKYNVYDLNILDVNASKNVITFKDIKNHNKKRLRIFNKNTYDKAYIIIPNKKYKELKIKGNKYYFKCKPNLNEGFSYVYKFTTTNNDKELTFSFKYPLNKITCSNVNKSIVINVPLNITSNSIATFEFSPREFLNENFELIGYNVPNNKNIILNSIEIYSSIEVYGIYVDREIDFVLISKTQTEQMKEEENKLDNHINENVDKIKSDINTISEKGSEGEIDIESEDKKSNLILNKITKFKGISGSNSSEISESNFSHLQIQMKKIKTNSSSGESQILQQSSKLTNTTLPILSHSNLSLPVGHYYSCSNLLKNNINAELNLNRNEPLLPQPIIHLDRISNYSPQNCKFFYAFIEKSYNQNKTIWYLTFCSNNFILQNCYSYNKTDNLLSSLFVNQLCYSSGISLNIDNLIFTNHKENIITAQGGNIIIYNQGIPAPLKIIKTKFQKIHVFDVNISNNLLLCVGTEQKDKSDVIVIYSIDNVTIRKIQNIEIPFLLRQISPFNIKDMKFNSNNTNKLISVGKENLRVWNIKNKCLRGKNMNIFPQLKPGVILNYLQEDPKCDSFVYCVSNCGDLIQVDINILKIVKIFHIENTLIISFFVNESFFVTGTIDGLIHLWYNCNTKENTNFDINTQNYIIQVRSENEDNGICCIKLIESLKENFFFCGSIKGDISLLDLKTKTFTNLIYSCHIVIKSIFIEPKGKYFITITEDGILHVWENGNNCKEIFEYKNKEENVTIISFPSCWDMTFIAGFDSGTIRVFIVNLEENKLQTIREVFLYKKENKKVIVVDTKKKQNKNKRKKSNKKSSNKNIKKTIVPENSHIYKPIIFIDYINNYSTLISMDDIGNITFNDMKGDFITIKQIIKSQESKVSNLSVSYDQKLFAYIYQENQVDANCILIYESKSYSIINKIVVDEYKINNICLFHQNLLCVIKENYQLNFYSLCTPKGILFKSLINSHHTKPIDNIIITKNFKYILTISKQEGIINVWSGRIISNRIISYQKCKLHEEGIECLYFNESKGDIITVPNKGKELFFWKFKGDIFYTEKDIESELEKIGEVCNIDDIITKNKTKFYLQVDHVKSYSSNNFKPIPLWMQRKNNNQKEKNEFTQYKVVININKEYNFKYINPNNELVQLNKKEEEILDKVKHLQPLKQINLFNAINEKQNEQDKTENSKLVYKNIEDYNQTKEILYETKQGEKSEIEQEKTNTIKKKLFISGNNFLPDRPDAINSNIPLQVKTFPYNEFDIDLYLGISTHSYHNIVIDLHRTFYAYTNNNKVIIEQLKEYRKQIILQDSIDEISCIALTAKEDYLLSGVALRNLGINTPIFVYKTSDWTLYNKLIFHYIGISQIIPVENNKYIISIGSYNEKSIAIWGTDNFKILSNKNVKFPIVALSVDYIYNYSLSAFTFNTITEHVLSLWQFDLASAKLTSVHFSHQDIESIPEIGEFFLSIETTPYYEYCKSLYILIGTNFGNIILLSKDLNNNIFLIKKYNLNLGNLNHLRFFNNKKFIMCSAKGILHRWKIKKDINPSKEMFDFLDKKDEDYKSFSFDMEINSLFTDNGDEFMCLDSNGSVYFLLDYIKEDEVHKSDNAPKKLLTFAHQDNNVSKIEIDSKGNIYSIDNIGKGIFIWDKESLYPIKGVIIPKNDIGSLRIKNIYYWNDAKKGKEYIICLIVKKTEIDEIAGDSYIEVFNLESLTSIGTINSIDKEGTEYPFDIYIFSTFAFITTNKGYLYYIQINEMSQLDLNIAKLTLSEEKPSRIVNIDYNYKKNIIAFCFKDSSIYLYSFQIEQTFNGIMALLKDIVDNINLLKYQIKIEEQLNDIDSSRNERELKLKFNTLEKYSISLKCQVIFPPKQPDIFYSCTETVSYIYVRDFIKKEVIKIIPLNSYHPSQFDLSDDEMYFLVGTKEGICILITRLNLKIYSGFNIEICNGHYDSVSCVIFKDNYLISASFNEIIKWKIK